MAQSDLDPQTVVETIRSRRTIHLFRPELPPESIVLEAVESARWAPNHRVTEPWHFYLLGPETAGRVSQMNYEIVLDEQGETAAQNKLQRWMAVPGWIAVSCLRSESEIRMREDFGACCCAIQNLSLHLWSHGIGTKWGTGPVTRDPRIYPTLDLDADIEELVGLLWYGYPAVIPGGHRNRTIDQILRRRP